MATFGVDVSVYQGPIDWATVAKSPIGFAICRATIGHIKDATYARNVAGAKAAGLIPGAYHFLYQGNAASQAHAFIDTVGDPTGLLTVVDVESNAGSSPQIDDVRAFAHEVGVAWGDHPLIVYTGAWYWRGHMGNPQGSDIGPLWHSRYVDPSPPGLLNVLFSEVTPDFWTPGIGGWDKATLIQFSSSGFVRGIAGRVDLNAYQGTLAELTALTQEVGVTPLSITSEVPIEVQVAKGTPYYDLDGKTVLDPNGPSADLDWRPSPFSVIPGWHAIYANVGALRRLVLVKPSNTRTVDSQAIADARAAEHEAVREAAIKAVSAL